MRSHSFLAAAAALVCTVSASARSTPLLTVFAGQSQLPTLAEIVAANTTNNNGTFLPLENIQADIFIGNKKAVETFVFFSISNVASFKSALKTHIIPLVTSTAAVLSPTAQQPLSLLNIAFSQAGITKLGITGSIGDAYFAGGQYADAPNLSDNTTIWETVWKGTSIHGMFLVGSDTQANVNTTVAQVENYFGTSIKVLTTIYGAARPGANAGHEHFGFVDGISAPAVQGFALSNLPGQSIASTGIILAGRNGDTVSRPAWAHDGAFMVFRKFQQLVPEYNNFLTANALQNEAGNLTTQQGADLLGARMIGRWKSGAPLDLFPTFDNPAVGADPNQNNNFNFSDPASLLPSDQTRCPFSSHMRKARPRSDTGNTNVLDQTIRSGIPFGPELNAAESVPGAKTQLFRGLAFVMYQSNIGNGFRTQQAKWLSGTAFPPGKNETIGIDAIVGQSPAGQTRMSYGLDPRDASRGISVPQFVLPVGGEYFFTPSISALTNTFAA